MNRKKLGPISKDALSRMVGFLQGTHHKHVYAVTTKLPAIVWRGFEFLVDLVAVYYSLEQDDTLPKLPDGHRAILTVAGTFSLVNHDYLRMSAYGGLTYSRLMHTSNEVSILQE